MKKIYDGFVYDTDKADLIGDANSLGESADSKSDFRYWEAGLYRTPRARRYFLAGRGGPMTRFASRAGSNTTRGDEGIIPLSLEEARQWATTYLPIEIVQQWFTIEEA